MPGYHAASWQGTLCCSLFHLKMPRIQSMLRTTLKILVETLNVVQLPRAEHWRFDARLAACIVGEAWGVLFLLEYLKGCGSLPDHCAERQLKQEKTKPGQCFPGWDGISSQLEILENIINFCCQDRNYCFLKNTG